MHRATDGPPSRDAQARAITLASGIRQFAGICRRRWQRITTEAMWLRRAALPPWRRGSIDVCSVAGGLGDELMVLGVLQSLARQAGAHKVTYHARHASVMISGVGRLDIVPFDPCTLPREIVRLIYLSRHPVPIMDQIARQLGHRLCDHTIALRGWETGDVPNGFPTRSRTIALQTTASEWTPNKQWPEGHWQSLVARIPEDYDVVELGTKSVFKTPPRHPRFRSLVGQTTLVQFAACVQHSRAFVGPSSGGMHLAHAYRVPSVVIIGGYEATYPYPLTKQFYTPVPCAPCWLRTPCPYDRRCLREISPDMVARAIIDILDEHTIPL